MTVLRSILLIVVALLVAAVVAEPTTAGPGPMWPPRHVSRPAAAQPIQVTVPTIASLAAAGYPWVQPAWVTRGGVMVARAPASNANLHVQPLWVAVGGVTLPMLPAQ
jgi:hypothetical protein